jgi:hypothetical protein
MRSVLVRSILPALLLFLALPMASHAQIGVGVSITVAPPELPVYEQPPLPEEGYMWTPGFWQWGPDGYFWVPGTWVQPPTAGVLWTPGYWGWSDGVYVFNAGYWGPHIGFYGGVNYGHGYGGVGFEGGEWRNGGFFYNRAVMNVGEVRVTNVYNRTVIVNNSTRVSFNGGSGGVAARPSPTELAATHEHHVAPTATQTEHVHAASTNHALLASVNHGAPAIAATPKAGVFSGKGVVTASHAGAVHTDRPATASHAQTHAPAVTHAAVTHEPATTHTPAVAHAPVSHAKPARPAPAAEHAEAKPMAAHPPAAAPHPQAQHAPPPRPRPAAQGHEEKHD